MLVSSRIIGLLIAPDVNHEMGKESVKINNWVILIFGDEFDHVSLKGLVFQNRFEHIFINMGIFPNRTPIKIIESTDQLTKEEIWNASGTIAELGHLGHWNKFVYHGEHNLTQASLYSDKNMSFPRETDNSTKIQTSCCGWHTALQPFNLDLVIQSIRKDVCARHNPFQHIDDGLLLHRTMHQIHLQ